MKDTTTFKRGQVWFIGDTRPVEGHIQRGPRPYLIVSNDVCNTYSSVLHVAPITSQPKCNMPTHVTYTDSAGRDNTVLLEQVTIKSIPHIIKCSNYKYTLSDEVMSKVEGAIMAQFQLPTSAYDASDDYEPQYEDNESEEDTQECTYDYVSQNDGTSEIAATSENKATSQIDKFNARMRKYEQMNNIDHTEEVPITRTKSGRVAWTEDLKKQFLRDYENSSIEEISTKYNMTVGSCYNAIGRFRKEGF